MLNGITFFKANGGICEDFTANSLDTIYPKDTGGLPMKLGSCNKKVYTELKHTLNTYDGVYHIYQKSAAPKVGSVDIKLLEKLQLELKIKQLLAAKKAAASKSAYGGSTGSSAYGGVNTGTSSSSAYGGFGSSSGSSSLYNSLPAKPAPKPPPQAKGCGNSIGFVAGGKPQYNSKGCITSYVVGLQILLI